MENNSLTTFGSRGSSNFLNLSYRKNKDYDYNRGYNAALRRCNKRAYKIFKRMAEAYMYATEEEDDDDDDED